MGAIGVSRMSHGSSSDKKALLGGTGTIQRGLTEGAIGVEATRRPFWGEPGPYRGGRQREP